LWLDIFIFRGEKTLHQEAQKFHREKMIISYFRVRRRSTFLKKTFSTASLGISKTVMNVTELVISFVVEHAGLLVAILALLIAFRSSSIASKSRRFAETAHKEAQRFQVFQKRTEILSEIDKQHAKYGTLLAVITEKLLLFQQNPRLTERFPGEQQRLAQNLQAIKGLQSRYAEQRQISEQVGEGADLARQEAALAEIRRLTIHIDEDIRKETRHLDDIKKFMAD
jgi:hypothetical protein